MALKIQDAFSGPIFLDGKRYDTVNDLLEAINAKSIKENADLTLEEKLLLCVLRHKYLSDCVNEKKTSQSSIKTEQTALFNEIKAILKKIKESLGDKIVAFIESSEKKILGKQLQGWSKLIITVPGLFFSELKRMSHEIKEKDEVIVSERYIDKFEMYYEPLKCPILKLVEDFFDYYLFLITKNQTKLMMKYYCPYCAGKINEVLYNFVRDKYNCKICKAYYLSLPSRGINNVPNVDSIDVFELAEIVKKAIQEKEKLQKSPSRLQRPH